MKMSRPTRRRLLIAGIAMSALSVLGSKAMADDGPVRWIIGYPPGGATDTIARLLSGPVSSKIGQTVIVDNRPGAGSSIAAVALAKSRPDGLTVMAVDNGTLVINPVAYSNLQYDPEKDFRPVGLYAEVNILLAVGKDQPFKTVAEFIDQAKAASTPIAYASPGIGSPLHLAMERLARDAGVKLEHVPYKGMAPALTDVLAGVVPSIVIDYTTAKEVIRSGELRPLAVFSKSRLEPLADIPTFGEQVLPGFSAGAWQGMVVPHDTPDEIVNRLTEALAFALKDDAVKKRYGDLGLGIPASSDPLAFSKRWQDDKAIFQPLIRDLGIKLDQ